MRKILAAAAVVLAIGLTGCSNSTAAKTAATPTTCAHYEDSSTVAKIQATGAFDTKPIVTFPAPISSKNIVTHVLIPGTGPQFHGSQMIRFEFSAFNAATGKQFAGSKYDGTDSVSQSFAPGQQIDFCKALNGVNAGSRVAILIPAAMAHKNKGDATSGIGKNDDVIFVMDITNVYYAKATGDAQPQASGAPSIIRATNGQPSVQIPKSAAPTALKFYTAIKSNDPQTLALGDTVTLQYSGFLWSNGTQFDSSWSKGPVQWKLTATGFIPGFVKALTASRDGGAAPHVGDEIMAIIPPKDGYGATAQGAIPANSTLVFVIDILGVDKAKK